MNKGAVVRRSFLTLCAMCAALITLVSVTVSHSGEGVSWLSPLFVALGGSALVLSTSLNTVVLRLLRGGDSPPAGALSVILALLKYPLLLFLLYLVNLQGSEKLLSFLVGFMSFLPAAALVLVTQRSGS